MNYNAIFLYLDFSVPILVHLQIDIDHLSLQSNLTKIDNDIYGRLNIALGIFSNVVQLLFKLSLIYLFSNNNPLDFWEYSWSSF